MLPTMAGGFKRSSRFLFALQRGDLERASGTDARLSERAAAQGGRTVDNSMTMAEPDLGDGASEVAVGSHAARSRRSRSG